MNASDAEGRMCECCDKAIKIVSNQLLLSETEVTATAAFAAAENIVLRVIADLYKIPALATSRI